MRSIGVTKYRSLDDYNYLESQWTSYSDIGKFYDNHIVTLEEYLEVENKYIQVAKFFFEQFNESNFRLLDVGKVDFDDYNFIEKDLLKEWHSNISEGILISVKYLDFVVKLIVRGYMWAIIEAEINRECKIKFSYDLYMSLISPFDLSKVSKKAIGIGLYIH